MNNVEIYNKYYNGLKFNIFTEDKIFKLKDIDENNMVEIGGFNYDGSSIYLDIDTVISSLKYKYWKITKLDLRKRKIEILKNDI
jgi:hypothetical protein